MQLCAVLQAGGQLALHDERNGSFMLIWKILSSFVKPGIWARIECSSGLYCRRAGGLQCLMNKMVLLF